MARLGDDEVDLAPLEQVVDPSQARAVAAAAAVLAERVAGGGPPQSLAALVAALDADVEERGMDSLCPWARAPGDLARPRALEVGAAVNRLRTLHVVAQREGAE